MSILIKDMEMPTRCWDCLLNTYGYCMASEHSDIIPADAPIPDWCPLVPVPPHGDLIDQDKYRDEFMNGVYSLCADDPDNNRANAIIDLFDYAPTIIPASEEGE